MSLVILISGRGSNMRAILDAGLPVAAVISNKPDAAGLAIAAVRGVKTAVIRDNDKDYQKNCVDNYAEYVMANARVFADSDNARHTFEVCLYEDNRLLCDTHLGPGRKAISVQNYMLANKADAAFELLKKAEKDMIAPAYIREAIAWIRQ